MENLQGTLLKGYKLEERIGNGGFGAVYRAKQSTIGREVAVKIILPGYANNPDFIRRFESEAHLIARLEHPHITPLHDFWRDPDGAYLVMRYLKGGSVRDALENSSYELNAASQLLDQIASALDFAHRNNVIHRDIKPGNILLDEDGNAYLADFGIAKDLAGFTDNKTAADAVVGSLDYLSPEQARSEPVTPRTDIYSLGVTLYEIITGEHPFMNATGIERLYKHINDPLPEVKNLPADNCDSVNEVIAKATAKNPDERFANVLEFSAALRKGIGRGGTQSDESIVEQLTMREQEILALIANNKTNREIADELVVTTSTVKWHITQLYKKLGVRSRVQAIVRGRELDLIVTGDTTDDLPFLTEQPISISLPEPENPYKGLHAFQMTDARDFFGRDDLTQKLVDKMCDGDPYYRFLAIVGPSGSGKSSLVKAGLIPALWKGSIGGSDKWFVVDMIPGTHPLDKLEAALIRVAANQANQLREQLQRDERGLLRVADIILPGDDTELVIVVDQFEELFTLLEDEKVRQHFLDLLRVAVSDVRSRVRVVVTLRADYYDRPLHYPEFGELIRSRMETVLPLSAKGLERAVRGPAERVGITFERGLVEQIVSQMNYQAGALPLLQYALTELFDRREGRILTNEAYQQIGGAVGALANRADEIYRGLTDDGQELAHQMFMRLVTLGEGTEDTRRRANHSELISITENTDLMEEIIDQFAAYRLLSLDHDPETRQPTVEVAHEAILREWDRLRQWLKESREDIRQERAVSRAAEEWNTHNHDASYLLRGTRLEQFEKWEQTTSLIQTPIVRDFIMESLRQREKEQHNEILRKERETAQEQRSRTLLRTLVAVFAVASIVAGGLALFAFNARDAEAQARADAEQSADEFQSIALTFGAQDALNNGQPDVALALAQEAINMITPPFAAQQIFYTASSSSWIQKRFIVSEARVWDVAYHPDGERIITTSWDGRAAIWNIDTSQELQSVQLGGRLTNIGIHPDGIQVVIGGSNGLLHVWNLETNEVMNLTIGEDQQQSPLFTSDGKWMVTSSDGKRIIIWDTESWEIIRAWDAHDATFLPGVNFSPDETMLVSASPDATVKVWDFETGDLLGSFDYTKVNTNGGTVWAWEPQFFSDGEQILIAGTAGITLWNWRTDEIVWHVTNPDRFVSVIEISPDYRTFVVSYYDGGAELRTMPDGNLLHSYYGHSTRIQTVDFSPNGRTFLTGSLDGTAIIFPVTWEGTVLTTEVPIASALAWHPTLPLIATVANSDFTQADPTIRLIDTLSGEIVQELEGHREAVRSLYFTPDGHYLISGDFATSHDVNDQHVLVWDWASGDTLFELRGHVGWVQDVAVSPDSSTLAVGESIGRQLSLWDIATGERIVQFNGHQDWINAVIFSPDGRYIYSGGRDGALFQWDVATGEIVQQFEGHDNEIWRVDVNNDGTKIVSASTDQTAVVWDVATGSADLVLNGHTQMVQDAEFSPDDTMIMTAGNDGRIILWDVSSGEQLFTFLSVSNPLHVQATFSPDGTQIASVVNSTLTIWNVTAIPTDYKKWVTENRYIPGLTCNQRALYQIEPLCETND